MMAILLLASSCEDFLDVNKNPNQAVGVEPGLVLPQAIVASAAITNSYNNYGAHLGGYQANAGGFSGFGNLFTYQLTPSDHNGLWTATYSDPLNDFKYVIDQTEGNVQMTYYNAAAKIMTVYLYMKLVDTFNDVPYTEALRGPEGIVAPAYDEGQDIYLDLITKLDAAYDQIDDIVPPTVPLNMPVVSDPLFAELASNTDAQMLAWKRFANTLKLKLLVKLDAAPSEFADPDFLVTNTALPGGGTRETGGFITDDVVVDPGYDLNKPSPTWNSWGRTPAGALSNSSRVPTTFSIAFYNSTKLDDAGRGRTIYVNFPATPNNQLGNEVGNPAIVAGQVTWQGTGAYSSVGVLKGPGMGVPLMLLAEAEFLLAEAKLNNKIPAVPGDMTSHFDAGIAASFRYLYKLDGAGDGASTPALLAGTNVATLVADYKTANDEVTDTDNDDHLVNIGEAADAAEQLEAIITQKYIALNMINSDEAYNEFRRTGYPRTVPGGLPAFDIASNKSTIDRTDRLPTRVMYPVTELSYNPKNYRAVDFESDLIFWDPN